MGIAGLYDKVGVVQLFLASIFVAIVARAGDKLVACINATLARFPRPFGLLCHDVFPMAIVVAHTSWLITVCPENLCEAMYRVDTRSPALL